MHFSKKQIIYLLLGIMLLACSVRVARIFVKSRLTADEITYIYNATDLSNGARESFKDSDGIYYPPPLLIFMMAGGIKMGFTGETSGQIITVLFGLLMTFGFFLVGKELFGKVEYGLMVAFLAAVQPYLCRISANIWRDGPYITFVVFALYFAILGAKSLNMKAWSLFALIAVFGAITRKEGFEIYIAFLIWLLIEAIFRYKEFRTTYLKLGKVFILVTVIFVGLFYVVYQLCQKNDYHWQPLQKYHKEL